MIDSAQLRRVNTEIAPDDPGQVCDRLGVDPSAVKEAATGMAFGERPEVVGLVIIALLVGIQAGQESQR